MAKYVVTGVAGFIGSNLADALLLEGHQVVGIDNFSTGKVEFIEKAQKNPNFQFFKRDLFESTSFDGLPIGHFDLLFHLSANADVRFGLEHPRRDLEQNTIVTSNVLEAVRKFKISGVAFSSTGSVYGEASVIPTPENAPFPAIRG